MERKHREMARAKLCTATGGLMEEDGFGEGPKRSVLGSSFLFHRAAGMEVSLPCACPEGESVFLIQKGRLLRREAPRKIR